MRHLVVLVAALALALAPAAAADAPIVLHDRFVYTETIDGVCTFPIVRHADEQHTRMLKYDDLPAGIHPSLRVLYQEWGKHFVRYDDVWENPLTGRAIAVHGSGPLNRTDLDVQFTVGADGLPDGTVTSTAHYAGTYIGTAPGIGVVLSFTGTTRYLERIWIVDGVRVRQAQRLLFTAGPGFIAPELCTYLAGQ